jgi:hypothetical protein
MKAAAIKSSRENESRAAADSIFQKKRSQKGFADNRSRPAEYRQTPNKNLIQMGGKTRYKFRQKTKEERFKRQTVVRTALKHKKNTRLAAIVRDLWKQGKLASIDRNLAQEPYHVSKDGIELWDGFTRLSWAVGFEDGFWSKQEQRKKNNRTEYLCRVGRGDNFDWLPRSRDTQANEDFATIGHKTQWRDYIRDHVEPRMFDVDEGKIEAISKKEAQDSYQDEKNLEPQGMSFNAQIAKQYSGDPIIQEWKQRKLHEK